MRFQCYFGGRYVVWIPSKDGPIVVAAGRVESEEFGRQLDALPPEERRAVRYDVPRLWNDPESELRSPFAYQN